MAYTLGSLRTYVRDLTGVYSTDLISDALLTSWINEVYFDVARQQEWPWLPVTALVNTGDAPAFSDEYRPLLAYRVAAKVLTVQADDTKRGELYTAEYKSILDAMYQDNLQALATDTMTSSAGVIRYVRDLLGIYDDTVTDTVITNLVSEVYTDLYNAFTWPWAESPIPYGNAGIGRALAYGTAGRLAPRYGKSADMVNAFNSEYQSAISLLKQTLLTNPSSSIVSYDRGTREWLRNHVRILTGQYSQNIPDLLLNDMINEEYQMLAFSQNWIWMRFEETIVYPAGYLNYPLSGPESSPYETTPPRKIENVYRVRVKDQSLPSEFLTYNSAEESEIVYNVPHVLDGVGSDVDFRYQLLENGLFVLTPTPTSDIVLKLRGLYTAANLENDEDTMHFDSKFAAVISYRVAVKVLTMSGISDQRVQLYDSQAKDLYELMLKEYVLSSSVEPLQLGGQGLITRKYLPWFRVS